MGDRKSHGSGPRGTPQDREKGTISVHFVRPVADAVRRRGLDPDPILEAAGIPPELLLLAPARVSPQQYSALWRLVIRHLDDEFFGQDSRRMKAGSFALLTRAVVHCNNLGSALDRAARFVSVLLDDFAISCNVDGDRAWLVINAHAGHSLEAVFAHETLLMMVYGLACWLVGRRIPISAAQFRYDAPPHASEYGPLFGPEVAFAQDYTRLGFSAALLRLPVVQDEHTAKDFLRVAPENILLRYRNSTSLAARIRRRLRQVAPELWPPLSTLAAELRTPPATLGRRLRAEGQTYQLIKDDLRRDLAIGLLRDSELSVQEVALRVGFVEPSAFHRAFRKWTHSSPAAYRRFRGALDSGGGN